MNTSPLAPLRVPAFRRLWTGQLAALLADGAFSTALIWMALASSGATGVSIVATARLLPRMLLTLVGGALADRVPKGTLLRTTAFAQAGAAGLLAMLAVGGTPAIWQLALAGGAAGAVSAPFFPALNALLPGTVDAKLLPAANGLAAAGRLLGMQFLGPALGGLLVGLCGASVAFAAMASSYAIAALVLGKVTSDAEQAAAQDSTPMRQAMWEGLRYVKSERWLLRLMIAFAAMNLLTAGPAATLVPALVDTQLGGGAAGLGALMACYGIGGGLAALCAGRIVPGADKAVQNRLYLAFAISSACLAALGLTGVLELAMVLYAVAGAAAELGNVMWITLMQRRVPERLLGRVSSLDWFLSLSLVPLSTSLSGVAGESVGVAPMLLWCGGLSVMILAVSAALRPARPEQAVRVPS
ncbi:MFS transporter [Streptomyces cyaneofuscatus]|uniref:MFS transporter n=1 Tax=Streptomyces cyaneofuscatus TaxID=66883 RepID=UPI0034154BFD